MGDVNPGSVHVRSGLRSSIQLCKLNSFSQSILCSVMDEFLQNPGNTSEGSGAQSKSFLRASVHLYLGNISTNYICWPRNEPDMNPMMSIADEK